MKLLIEELPETSIVSIGHRPGLEAFHTRELTLEPGKNGATLHQLRRKRALKDVYRRISAASRAHPRDPGFWSTLRSRVAPPPKKKKR